MRTGFTPPSIDNPQPSLRTRRPRRSGAARRPPRPVGSAPLKLARVKRFLLRSACSGYEVVPVGGSGTTTTVQVVSQSSAPRAGRSLVVRLSGARFTARLAVRPALAVR